MFSMNDLPPDLPSEFRFCKKLRYYSVDNYIRNGYSSFMADENQKTSLTPAVFHILLALSNGELHGYAIMKQTEADSDGRVKMGAGTLYGSIKRMLDAGLIAESGKRVDAEMDDARRVYYRITGAGEKALADELARMQGIVSLARRLDLLPKNFGYEI